MAAIGFGLQAEAEVESYEEILSLEEDLVVGEKGEEEGVGGAVRRRQRGGGERVGGDCDGGGGSSENSLPPVFLAKLMDATGSRSEISCLLPFFAFNSLGSLIAATTTFIDLYMSDYQSGLLRLLLIVDDVALFGGGIVTAACFHSWLGASPTWSALIQWMCKKRIVCGGGIENEVPMPSIVI
jgi:hypothetical protein